MAVPTAVATSIRYKGVDYAHGTPIVFTELKPVVEVTFSVADFNNHLIQVSAGTTYQVGYELIDTRGLGEVVTSTILRQPLTVTANTTALTLYPYNTDGLGGARVWVVSTSLATGSEYSWQHLGSVILKDTLVANLEASELAVITQTIASVEHNKIFWEGVEDQFQQPYIMLQHMSGGATNRSQAKEADMTWRVAVQTGTLAEAMVMEEAINKALEYEYPVVNFSGVSGIGVIEEILPITDRYTLSNEDVYLSGGIYRLRLIKE